MGWQFWMSQSLSCKVLAIAARNLFFHGLHPAQSKLAPGGIPTKDLAMIFDNVPFLHIVVGVNASLDGSGDLRTTNLVGIVIDM